MTEQQLIYLYCVMQEQPPMKSTDGLANSIHFVCHEGLYATVCNVEENEFGEQNFKNNLANLEWVKTHAQMHEKVIEQVMADTCVIPFKFGTLFNTEDSLKAMLQEYGQEFKALLQKLDNKEEWGVKIYCDKERFKGNLINDEPEVLKIENEIKSSSVGKAFFL